MDFGSGDFLTESGGSISLFDDSSAPSEDWERLMSLSVLNFGREGPDDGLGF